MTTRPRGAPRAWPAAIGILIAALGAEALAQSTSPICLVVGAPAGGSIDTYSLIIADHMTGTLGRPVIIEIKAGANGNIAAQWSSTRPPTATWCGSAPSP